jgi:NitT/TauT family transport system substrate-binding protein
VDASAEGEMEAMLNLDPVLAQVEAAGTVTILFDTRLAKGFTEAPGGAYHAATLDTTEVHLAKNPGTVQALEQW